jgi:hypothetical protein
MSRVSCQAPCCSERERGSCQPRVCGPDVQRTRGRSRHSCDAGAARRRCRRFRCRDDSCRGCSPASVRPTTCRCSSLASARGGSPTRAPQARPGSPTRAPAGAGSPTPTRLRSAGCSPIARPAARRTSLRTVVRPVPLSAFPCACAHVSPGALAVSSHPALLPASARSGL